MGTQEMKDLSYVEKQSRLNDRIRAHKKFANFDIDEWIEKFLEKKPRRDIFDLGCGNGNHLGLYLAAVPAAGSVTGLDREQSLIEEARRNYKDAGNLDLRQGSMDDQLPFGDASFDLIFCNFAIYNAANPKKTINELKRVLKNGGELVLIGPTAANAKEIYEYNARLTGTAVDPITFIRTDRLRQEILPIVKDAFKDVTEEVINSYLTFPDDNEFLRYYRATMLYEEGAEKQGKTMEEMRDACVSKTNIILSKEMLAVVATK
jgi:ubiquinone/menaquinone biosynthesis C-methylase UbiE